MVMMDRREIGRQVLQMDKMYTLVPVFGAGHCLLLDEGWRLAGHLVGRS